VDFARRGFRPFGQAQEGCIFRCVKHAPSPKKIYDIFDEINENDIWSLNKICADKQCGNSQRREFLGGCHKPDLPIV
jgi:hypothetical protein